MKAKTIVCSLPVIERIAFIVAAVISTALHIRFVTNVGGLWRDEVNSVNLSTLPRITDLGHFLDFDSFPVAFFAVLRTWTAIFGAANDFALRSMGLLIGISILFALWLNAKSLRAGLPILSLALVGLNPMVIRYGDSIRAYGLGIFLILLTFWSFWRLIDSSLPPSIWRIFQATFFALLSVQCLYYNAVLLFAVAMGAVAVAVRASAWRTAVTIFAIGALAALSLVPYLPMIRRMHEWTFMVSFPVTFEWLWIRVREVIGSPDSLLTWVWIALMVLALGTALGVLLQNRRSALPQRRVPDAVLFSLTTLIVGLVCYAVFLKALNYYTQPWYYVTIVAFAAVALDIALGAWPSGTKLGLVMRGIRVIFAVGLVALAGLPAWNEMTIRHTNVDLIGKKLQALAGEGDVILVPRWECGIPVSRYYRGAAKIITLPPIEDHRFHRYDSILKEMMKTDPLKETFGQLTEALQSGKRVFIAGSLPYPKEEPASAVPPPATRDKGGEWHLHGAYNTVWLMQTGYFLRLHGIHGTHIKVPLPAGTQVNAFENLELSFIEGWH